MAGRGDEYSWIGTASPGPGLPPRGLIAPEYHSPHIGHSNHLCHLADSGEVTLDQIKALVRDPKFICKKCGRAAAKADNLCEPVPL